MSLLKQNKITTTNIKTKKRKKERRKRKDVKRKNVRRRKANCKKTLTLVFLRMKKMKLTGKSILYTDCEV
jgi:hypothetical protein